MVSASNLEVGWAEEGWLKVVEGGKGRVAISSRPTTNGGTPPLWERCIDVRVTSRRSNSLGSYL